METGEYRRSVAIRGPIADALAFASNPLHLPEWTRFFLSVDPAREENPGSHEAMTVFGPARVSMPVRRIGQGALILLEVETAASRNSASIELEPDREGCRVTFTTGFPADWPPGRVEAQLLRLESELEALKACLELRSEFHPGELHQKEPGSAYE